MATPLPTTGITGGISETGVATIAVPLFVETLAEALTALPNLGVGIPYRSRSFTQEDDGGFKVTLHYEGISNDAPSDDQVTFELDTSMAEDPIQTHPFFDTLKTRYAWDAAKEQFAETLPEASGQSTALSGSGKKPKKNPMFGVDNWLVVGAVFRKTYAAKTIPSSILRGIGTIVDRPPGIEQFKIPGAAKKRNWLKMAPKIKRKGNAVEITEEYFPKPLHQRLTSETGVCMTEFLTTLTPAPKSNASAQDSTSHRQQRPAGDQNLHHREPRQTALSALVLQGRQAGAPQLRRSERSQAGGPRHPRRPRPR